MVDQDDHGTGQPGYLPAIRQHLAHVLAAVLIAPGHDLRQRVHHHQVELAFSPHLLDHRFDVHVFHEVGCLIDELHGQVSGQDALVLAVRLHPLAHVLLPLRRDPAHPGTLHPEVPPRDRPGHRRHQVEHEERLARARGAVDHAQRGVGDQALDDPACLLPLNELGGVFEPKSLLTGCRDLPHDLVSLQQLRALGDVVEPGQQRSLGGGLWLGLLRMLDPQVVQRPVGVLIAVGERHVEGMVVAGKDGQHGGVVQPCAVQLHPDHMQGARPVGGGLRPVQQELPGHGRDVEALDVRQQHLGD